MAEFGEIPGLYDKFRILIAHGHYKDWDALAQAFNVKSGTIKAWGHGSLKQKANWVPTVHQQRLVPVFAKAFADDCGPSKIRALILASVADFERELLLSKAPVLGSLIETEGRNTLCDVFLKSSKLTLVKREDAKNPEPQALIALGQFFRLAFRTGFHGAYSYALQHVRDAGLWGPVEFGFIPSGRTIHVPGSGDDHQPGFMAEHDHKGHHRFAVLQTQHPFPASAQSALRQASVLDLRTLDDIASFYADQKKTERRIFYIDIEITAETPSTEDRELEPA